MAIRRSLQRLSRALHLHRHQTTLSPARYDSLLSLKMVDSNQDGPENGQDIALSPLDRTETPSTSSGVSPKGRARVAPYSRESSQYSTALPQIEHNDPNEFGPVNVLTEANCPNVLAYSWPTWKKWLHLAVVFFVQISMNYNASVVGNALGPLEDAFGITNLMARIQMCVFLVAYAFGCELWAPWSEEYGRQYVLGGSLMLVNIWALMAACADNFTTVLAARALGGLCSAGGSITLGIVADMYRPEEQGYAVNFVVLASVAGSVVGPVAGGYLEVYTIWQWNFWSQVIFGLVVMSAFIFLPETRAKVLLDREAKRLRKAGDPSVFGPGESLKLMSFKRIITGNWETWKHIFQIWFRPFKMFLFEPIVLFLSLLSGFSDALIFTFLNSYGIVYEAYGLTPIQLGHGFLFLILGYFIAWGLYVWDYGRLCRLRTQTGADRIRPESRLYLLLWLAPLEVIGMLAFAWTSKPEYCSSPWVSLGINTLVGIANYAIYQATIDYMVAAYGPYAASATGGNGFARDFLAGISALYAGPMYKNIGSNPIPFASTTLACIAVLVIAPIYVFYFYGESIRSHSKMAQECLRDEEAREHAEAALRHQAA